MAIGDGLGRPSAFKRGIPVASRSIQLPVAAWQRARELATAHRTTIPGIIVMGLRALDRLTPRGEEFKAPPVEAEPPPPETRSHALARARIVGATTNRDAGAFHRAPLILRLTGALNSEFMLCLRYDGDNATGQPLTDDEFANLVFDGAAIRIAGAERVTPSSYGWTIPAGFGSERANFVAALQKAGAVVRRVGDLYVVLEAVGNPVREAWSQRSLAGARKAFDTDPEAALHLAARAHALAVRVTPEIVAYHVAALDRSGRGTEATSVRTTARGTHGSVFDANVGALLDALAKT